MNIFLIKKVDKKCRFLTFSGRLNVSDLQWRAGPRFLRPRPATNTSALRQAPVCLPQVCLGELIVFTSGHSGKRAFFTYHVSSCVRMLSEKTHKHSVSEMIENGRQRLLRVQILFDLYRPDGSCAPSFLVCGTTHSTGTGPTGGCAPPSRGATIQVERRRTPLVGTSSNCCCCCCCCTTSAASVAASESAAAVSAAP
jgi:hypothetical protein